MKIKTDVGSNHFNSSVVSLYTLSYNFVFGCQTVLFATMSYRFSCLLESVQAKVSEIKKVFLPHAYACIYVYLHIKGLRHPVLKNKTDLK